MNIGDPDDPTARRIRDKIDLKGGPLAPWTEPWVSSRTLQGIDFADMLVSIHFLQEVLNRRSAENGGPEMSVHLTRSTDMRVFIVNASPEHSAILVPAGAMARFQVMHRLLMSYWSRQDQPPTFLRSIMDRPNEHRKFPIALAPLLAQVNAESDSAQWWSALDALSDQIELEAKAQPDVGELNHLALSWVLSHEFAHAARRHEDVVKKVAAGQLVFEVGHGADRRQGTPKELQRAVENEADRIASYLIFLTMLEQCAQQPDRLPVGFVRIGYSVTASMALFRPEAMFMAQFGPESGYAHPLVRHDAMLRDAADCAENLGPRDQFEVNALFGARKCLEALGHVEFEVYSKSKFVSDGEECEPVLHALRGSMSNAMDLFQERQWNDALTLRLTTLINEHHGEFRF